MQAKPLQSLNDFFNKEVWFCPKTIYGRNVVNKLFYFEQIYDALFNKAHTLSYILWQTSRTISISRCGIKDYVIVHKIMFVDASQGMYYE